MMEIFGESPFAVITTLSGCDEPELSSTAALTQPGFHRHEEYTELVF